MTGAGANLPEDSIKRGNKETPGLLKAAGVSCTVTQAAHIGTSKLLAKGGEHAGSADFYEAACDQGLGYIVISEKNKPPVAIDCILAAQARKMACMLPMNRHPAAALDSYLKAAGTVCTALRARQVAQDSSQKWRAFEVECHEGGGYILSIPLPDGTGPAPEAADCLQVPGACTLTPHVESVAMLAHAVGVALGTDCQISDARYVGYVDAKQRDLYELSCQKGHDGLLVEVDGRGAVRGGMPCSSTKLSGASCQLKPGDVADPFILHAERSGAAPPVSVTHADWITKPTGDDFSNLYPERAQRNWLSGEAEVTCRADVAGMLKDCFVTDESPAGYGFGEAALKMSAKFRMKPATEDGVPIAGERVTIPINFVLPKLINGSTVLLLH